MLHVLLMVGVQITIVEKLFKMKIVHNKYTERLEFETGDGEWLAICLNSRTWTGYVNLKLTGANLKYILSVGPTFVIMKIIQCEYFIQPSVIRMILYMNNYL